MPAPTGICHICGENKKLSFEHVPPKAAFNDKPLLYARIQELFRSDTLENFTTDERQKGMGGYTLCERCNNDTGRWYGGAYADWAYQGMQIVQRTNGLPTLVYPFNIFPLRIIKQIVCMFFSVNSPGFQAVQPELVKFVLDREVRYLPRSIRIYAFYTLTPRIRTSGVTGIVTMNNFRSGTTFSVVSEITFPPFGFLMTLGNSPQHNKLCDITWFSEFSYRAWRAPLFLKLPIMPIYTPYPTDYRTREEVIKSVKEQKAKYETAPDASSEVV